MTRQELLTEILSKRSFLCIGLDTDIDKIPKHLLNEPDPVFEFNRNIIDATKDLCVAYKLNTSFYEVNGSKGWESLMKTWQHIPKNIFTIADAKRGDIGNSSSMYAKAFFDEERSGMNFDAVTVNPYMGEDSVKPFLHFEGKWAILLALTSNAGSADFQLSTTLAGTSGQKDSDDYARQKQTPLFKIVLEKSTQWGSQDNMMYVIGATHPEMFAQIRTIIPDHFLLVPGVGTQGGDLSAVAKNGMNDQCGLLVNASRSIIYAGNDTSFADLARKETRKIQEEMAMLLDNKNL